MTTKVRKSVPLTPADVDSVVALRVDIMWREAAREVAGVEMSTQPSEAEALHALVEVGRRVLVERVNAKEMEAGYAALVAAQSADDLAISRATGRRTAGLND